MAYFFEETPNLPTYLTRSLENIYVLSGTLEAINLYLDSLEALKDNTTFDFMVYSFDRYNIEKEVEKVMEEMQTWETSVLVTEKTYHDLYLNLCQKLREWSNKR